MINIFFKQIKTEQCIFKQIVHNKTKCIIRHLIDDIIITGETKIHQRCNNKKLKENSKYQIEDQSNIF